MAHGFFSMRSPCVLNIVHCTHEWRAALRFMSLKVCFTVPSGKGANPCGPNGLFDIGLFPRPIIR